MATGRTITDFQRLYIGGYDLSGYAMDSGEQGVMYQESSGYAFADAVKGALIGKPRVSFGPITAVFDNTATSGFHVLADAAKGSLRYVMLAYGMRAEPAMGDDVFCIPAWQRAYKATNSGNLSTCRIDLSTVDTASAILYNQFWGKLLHTHVTCGAANSANDNVDNGAATTAGGWMMYHIQSVAGGAGTVTISIDDSANGTDWLALSGATTAAIAYDAAPTAGIIQLGVTATVRQYLRWQYAEAGGATSAIFSLAFMRGK